jgi:putative IMPACT (imprinted ancient) family translation regulator
MVAVPYALFERIRLLIDHHQGQILEEDFAGDVTVTARIRQEGWSAFQVALQELSNGTIEALIVESDEATRFLVER